MAASDHSVTNNTAGAEVASEERLRANSYALLAALLRQPPGTTTLTELSGLPRAGLPRDDSEMGRALTALADAARGTTPEAVEEEFFRLFVGVGDSELKPYGSYYLTGFLFEKPLAKLRTDMAALGIGRAEGVVEPEDHIAALCEMMSGMIEGGFGAPVPLARQRAFFEQHIAPWAARFFEDLEAASEAPFYRPVGTIGRLFLRIETQSFEMAA